MNQIEIRVQQLKLQLVMSKRVTLSLDYALQINQLVETLLE